ncbi:MAG: response regulator [Deltaproteobacteria bacterium]|nr:response regulator [Deltaproteobacteria bacterium]
MRAVLVARDDRVTRACWRALHASGCSVQIAAELESAGTVVETVTPDVVVLDGVSDPALAAATARAIRDVTRKCLLFAVVEDGDARSSQALVDIGVDGIIQVSEDGGELLARTQRALSNALERGDTMLIEAMELGAAIRGAERSTETHSTDHAVHPPLRTAARRADSMLLGLATHLASVDRKELDSAVQTAISSFAHTFEMGLMLVFRDVGGGELTPWVGWHEGRPLDALAADSLATRLDLLPQLGKHVERHGPIWAGPAAALPEGTELTQAAMRGLSLDALTALPLMLGGQRMGLLVVGHLGSTAPPSRTDENALERLANLIAGVTRRLRRDADADSGGEVPPLVDARLRALAAIGREFHQLVSVLDGHVRLLGMGAGPEARRDLVATQAAIERMRLLGEQMESFTTAGGQRAVALHLNDFVVEFEPLGRALLGPGVAISAVSDASRPWGTVDPRRLRSVIGEILVEACQDEAPRQVVLRSRDATHVGAVAIEVALHGGELSASSVRRLESTSRAAGLVFRVEGRDADVTVASVLVPSTRRPREATQTSPFRRTTNSVKTSVLVVEDEPMQRRMVARVLSRLGLHVVEAASAEAALEIAARDPNAWHLLVTDVCLPHRSGPSLARELMTRNTTLQTLFVSGYADISGVERELGGPANFLQKPFRQQELSDRVNELLADVA